MTESNIVNNRITNQSPGYILVIDKPAAGVEIKRQLNTCNKKVLLATSAVKALSLYRDYSVDMVLVSVSLPDASTADVIKQIQRTKESDSVILVMAENVNDEALQQCIRAGANDVLIKPFSESVLQARIQSMEQLIELRKLYGEVQEEKKIARRIFDAAIETRNTTIKGMQIHRQAADIFSGDMALTARHPQGDIYVLMADLTGHGLSAAIAVLPVSEVFCDMVEKGCDAEEILVGINDKLLSLLPTGMFMACCLLKINLALKTMSAWNAGMPDVYVIDKNIRSIKKQFRSLNIPLGITVLEQANIVFETISINRQSQVYMFSDGFTDVINSNGTMFGVERFEALLAEKMTEENQFKGIIDAFNAFYGECKPQDDITLINIPFGQLLQPNEEHRKTSASVYE